MTQCESFKFRSLAEQVQNMLCILQGNALISTQKVYRLHGAKENWIVTKYGYI